MTKIRYNYVLAILKHQHNLPSYRWLNYFDDDKPPCIHSLFCSLVKLILQESLVCNKTTRGLRAINIGGFHFLFFSCPQRMIDLYLQPNSHASATKHKIMSFNGDGYERSTSLSFSTRLPNRFKLRKPIFTL